ncbi:MAG: F, portal protein, partial [Gammaproteobacteria bacterium]
KVVLSQTMTTDDGSSRSQAEVHAGVRQEVIDADADLIADSFRRTIGTWLTEWNFPGAATPHVVRNTEPEEDLATRAERDTKIHALGYNPTDDYIEETYGIGWEKREEPEIEPGLMTTGKGPMPAEFAELNDLLQARTGHREDQQVIADAAALLATQYKGIIGKRVEQLLGFLEETKDIETFQEKITELMAETAPDPAVEAIQKATVVGRLMGMLRGERN